MRKYKFKYVSVLMLLLVAVGFTSCDDSDDFYYYGRDSYIHEYISYDYLEVDLGENLDNNPDLPIVCVYQFYRDGRGIEFVKLFNGEIVDDRDIYYNTGYANGREFIEINYYGDNAHKEYYQIYGMNGGDLKVKHFLNYIDFRDNINGYNSTMFRIPYVDLPIPRTRVETKR